MAIGARAVVVVIDEDDADAFVCGWRLCLPCLPACCIVLLPALPACSLPCLPCLLLAAAGSCLLACCLLLERHLDLAALLLQLPAALLLPCPGCCRGRLPAACCIVGARRIAGPGLCAI